MSVEELFRSPKMLRETLCVAQSGILALARDSRTNYHLARLQELIDECDRRRPLGPDGRHGRLHTPLCGCDEDER